MNPGIETGICHLVAQGDSMKSCTLKQGPRVLVVDDHEISRLHIVQALRQITGDVKQACNEREAIEEAIRQLPDLIFMDLHLPGTCGISLLNLIRKSWPPGRQWPEIVMLTGDCSPQAMQQIRNAPVSAVLIKPVLANEIRDASVRLLQLDQGVREKTADDAGDIPLVKLRSMFQQELQIRLPELDRDICNLDWASARGILHQLTAASAMCNEKDFERHCRQLFDVLDENPEPGAIGNSYYSFLQSMGRIGIPLQA